MKIAGYILLGFAMAAGLIGLLRLCGWSTKNTCEYKDCKSCVYNDSCNKEESEGLNNDSNNNY